MGTTTISWYKRINNEKRPKGETKLNYGSRSRFLYFHFLFFHSVIYNTDAIKKNIKVCNMFMIRMWQNSKGVTYAFESFFCIHVSYFIMLNKAYTYSAIKFSSIITLYTCYLKKLTNQLIVENNNGKKSWKA